jgi:hypothetical protein
MISEILWNSALQIWNEDRLRDFTDRRMVADSEVLLLLECIRFEELSPFHFFEFISSAFEFLTPQYDFIIARGLHFRVPCPGRRGSPRRNLSSEWDYCALHEAMRRQHGHGLVEVFAPLTERPVSFELS